MSPTSDPDPVDPLQDAIRRATAPMRAAAEDIVRQATTPARAAAERAILQATAPARAAAERAVTQATTPARIAAERAMLQAVQAAVWKAPNPNALLTEQTRRLLAGYVTATPQVDLAKLQDRIHTSYSYSTDSAARAAMAAVITSFSYHRGSAASSLAASTMVRLAADPALAEAMRADSVVTPEGPGPVGTAEDVQRVAAAHLNQVTGGQPEGWRWLLLTKDGRETLTLILTLVGVLVAIGTGVQDFINNQEDDQSTVEVDNSPGSTINIAPSPDGDDQPSVSVKDSPGATVNVAPSPDEDERRDVPPETCGP